MIYTFPLLLHIIWGVLFWSLEKEIWNVKALQWILLVLNAIYVIPSMIQIHLSGQIKEYEVWLQCKICTPKTRKIDVNKVWKLALLWWLIIRTGSLFLLVIKQNEAIKNWCAPGFSKRKSGFPSNFLNWEKIWISK